MTRSKIGGLAQKIVSTVFFFVTFAYLFYLYITLRYLPLFLASILIIMPVLVNIFLHLFSCKFSTTKPEKQILDEKTKKVKKVLANIFYIIKNFSV